MSWGTLLASVGRGTCTGSFERPSRTYPGRSHCSTEVNAHHRRNNGSFGSPQTPGRIPWGESAPGYGKRPVRRPVGGSAAGRFSHQRPGAHRPARRSRAEARQRPTGPHQPDRAAPTEQPRPRRSPAPAIRTGSIARAGTVGPRRTPRKQPLNAESPRTPRSGGASAVRGAKAVGRRGRDRAEVLQVVRWLRGSLVQRPSTGTKSRRTSPV